MKIRLTGPMQRMMTPEMGRRIERTVLEFPELEPHTVTIGLVAKARIHGCAEAEQMAFA